MKTLDSWLEDAAPEKTAKKIVPRRVTHRPLSVFRPTRCQLTQNAKNPAQACLDPIQTVGLMGFCALSNRWVADLTASDAFAIFTCR